jgi:hypothetical protein
MSNKKFRQNGWMSFYRRKIAHFGRLLHSIIQYIPFQRDETVLNYATCGNQYLTSIKLILFYAAMITPTHGAALEFMITNQQEWMLRRAEFTQLYQIISVEGDKLEFQSRTAAGNLYDKFQMRKIAGKAAEFIDLQPLTPERRKSESTTKSDPSLKIK